MSHHENSKQQRLFLGVDGGQSSTTAWIADERGGVIGRGLGGPCNHARAAEGRRKFLSAVGDCLRQACQQAELSAETVQFEAVCFGLSGGAEDKADYIYEVIRSRQYKVTHDGEIALTGATGGRPGIIIIGGTGSFAFGKNAEGVTARSGGWGYVFGDEGGGFDLTRRALRAALRMEEGWGPETALRQALLEATSTASANQLLHDFYADVPRATVAGYAPLITQAAEQGDAVAAEILNDAARELSRYVAGVYGQLFTPGTTVAVRYIGGVFQSQLLVSRFAHELKRIVNADVGPPRYLPVAGALLESFQMAGLAVDIDDGIERGSDS